MLVSAQKYIGAFAIGDIKNYPAAPLKDWGFDYLALTPPDDSPRSEIPVHWRGSAAFAYVASLSVVPRPDVTKPLESELAGVIPTPIPGPDGVDDHCDRCNGSGVIRAADGHSYRCSNPRCPYRDRVHERDVTIRRADGTAVVEQHLFQLSM